MPAKSKSASQPIQTATRSTKSRVTKRASTRAEQDTHYRQLFNASPDALFVLDPKGHILDCNIVAVKRYGYAREELLQMTARDLAAPDLQAQAAEHVRQAIETGAQFEWRQCRKDGSEIQVEISAHPFDLDGQKCILSAVRDITERKRAEEKLRESEELWHALVANSPDFIAEHDQQGRFVFLNHYAEGFNEQNVLGKSFEGFVEPNNLEAFTQKFQDCLCTQKTQTLQYTAYGDGKTYRWYEQSFTPFVRADQVHVLAVARDITDSKLAEQKLAASEHNFRVLFDTMTEGVALNQAIYDETGAVIDYRILQVNSAFYSTADYQGDTVIGNVATRLYGISSDYIKSFWQEQIKRKQTFYTEYTSPLKNKVFSIATSPLVGDKFVVTFTDITERKRGDKALLLATERLSLAQQAAQAGAWNWDMDTGDLDWAPELYQLFGLDASTTRATFDTWRSVLHPQDRQVAEDRINAAIRDHVRLDSEYRVILPSTGAEHWIYAIGETTYDDQGIPKRMAGICLDITARKHAEQTTRFQSEIAANLSEGICLVRVADNVIAYSNDQFEKMFGYTAGELIGKSAAVLNAPTNTHSSEEVALNILQAVKHNQKWTGEIYNQRRDGTPFWTSASISQFEHSEFGLVQVSIQQDISDRKQASETLQKSEERFRMLYQHSPYCIHQIDLQGRLLTMNPSGLKMMGVEEEGAIRGMPYLDAVAELDKARVGDLLAQAIQGQASEFEFTSSNGLHFQSSFVPLRDAAGRIVQLMGLTIDITERKQTEEALARLYTLVPDMICVASTDGYFKQLNPVWESTLGFTNAELMAKPFASFIHPDDLASTMAEVARQIDGAATINFINRYLCKDGSYKCLEWVANPSPDGKLLYAAARDITERKRMEQLLNTNIEFLNDSQSIAKMGSWELDLVTNTAYWSDNCYALYGFKPNEIVPSFEYFKSRVYADDLPIVERGFDQVFRSHEPSSVELRLISPDGTLKWIQNNMIPVFENEQPVKLRGVQIDITERKHAEQALRASQNMLSTVFRSSPIAIGITRLSDNTFLDVNEAWIKLVGYAKEQVIGRTATDLMGWFDPTERQKCFRLLNEQGRVRDFEFRLCNKSGAIIDCSLSIEKLMLEEPCLLAMAQDITERKRAEQALRDSESRYRSLFEDSAMPIWEEDFSKVKAYFDRARADGTHDWRFYFDQHPEAIGECASLIQIREVNQASLKFFQVTSKEEIIRHLPFYFVEESWTVFKEEMIALAEGRLRFESEITIATLDGQVKKLILSLSVVPDYKDTLARVLVSFVDISNLKHAEQALRESETRYRRLIENIPDIIYVFSDKRGGIYYSPTVEKLLGYTADYLCAHPFLWNESIHPDDLPVIAQAIKDSNAGEPFHVEYRVRDAQGQWRWFFDRSLTRQTQDGETLIEGLATDITERKQADEKLRESESRYRLISENAADVIWVMDPASGKFKYVSPSVEKLRGYTPAEVMAQPISESLTPESLQQVGERLAARLPAFMAQGSGTRSFTDLVDQPRRDGSIVHTEVTTTYMFNEQGQVEIVGVTRDVTERLRAEQAVRTSEERYRSLFDNMTEGFAFHELIFDQDGKPFDYRFLDINHAFEELTGLKRADVVGKGQKEVMPTEDPFWFNTYVQVALTGEPTRIEHLSSALERYFEVFAYSPAQNQFAVVFTDITERKRAEEKLRESEERYRAVSNLTSDYAYSFRMNPDGTSARDWTTDSFTRITGYAADDPQFSQGISSIVHPDDRWILQDRNRRDAAGEPVGAVDIRIIRRDGEIRWVSNVGRSVRDETGHATHFIGAVQDITERKRAEEKLSESEERYRHLIESANDWVWEVNQKGIYTFVSHHSLDLLGYAPEELLGTSPFDLMPPEEAERVGHIFASYAREHQPFRLLENANYHKDGRLVILETNGVPIFDANGNYIGYRGMDRDITERKLMEEAIRESEEKYRTLVESQESAITTVDAQGEIHYLNALAAKIFGGTPETLQGKNIRELVPPPASERQAQFARQVIETGQGIVREDQGRDRWYRTSVQPIRNAAGQVTLALVNAMDITERRRAEERIQRQLDRINALRAIDNAISTSFDVRITLDVVLEKAISGLGVDAACVLFFDQNLQSFKFVEGRGIRMPVSHAVTWRLSEDHAARAILSRQLAQIQDLKTLASSFSRAASIVKQGLTAYIGVPLIIKGNVLGVLEIYTRALRTFDSEALDFANALADQAAIAVDNAQMFDDLQRTNLDLTFAYDATIEGWARALEMRDQASMGQTQRELNLALVLAHAAKIPEAELIHFRRGALLHDIGKLALPDNILLKPGALMPDELKIMQKHPTYARDMLAAIDYLRPALDIPYCHHEKWDGSGYPRGLAGEQIPLAARIFTIVDVWDALSSDRPYRRAWTKSRVQEYLREQSGKHFDPKILEIFLGLPNL